MAQYPELKRLTAAITPANAAAFNWNAVVGYLCDVWLRDHARARGSGSVVETSTGGFSYLFDYDAQRLISAWGISHGRHAGARDAARMQGHPLNDSAHYDRGHAIPHRLGGPTDINLVPQLAQINRGPFRPLEIKAVKTPDSLYFTYWSYVGTSRVKGHPGQTPTACDQGLIAPGAAPNIRHHGN